MSDLNRYLDPYRQFVRNRDGDAVASPVQPSRVTPRPAGSLLTQQGTPFTLPGNRLGSQQGRVLTTQPVGIGIPTTLPVSRTVAQDSQPLTVGQVARAVGGGTLRVVSEIFEPFQLAQDLTFAVAAGLGGKDKTLTERLTDVGNNVLFVGKQLPKYFNPFELAERGVTGADLLNIYGVENELARTIGGIGLDIFADPLLVGGWISGVGRAMNTISRMGSAPKAATRAAAAATAAGATKGATTKAAKAAAKAARNASLIEGPGKDLILLGRKLNDQLSISGAYRGIKSTLPPQVSQAIDDAAMGVIKSVFNFRIGRKASAADEFTAAFTDYSKLAVGDYVLPQGLASFLQMGEAGVQTYKARGLAQQTGRNLQDTVLEALLDMSNILGDQAAPWMKNIGKSMQGHMKVANEANNVPRILRDVLLDEVYNSARKVGLVGADGARAMQASTNRMMQHAGEFLGDVMGATTGIGRMERSASLQISRNRVMEAAKRANFDPNIAARKFDELREIVVGTNSLLGYHLSAYEPVKRRLLQALGESGLDTDTAMNVWDTILRSGMLGSDIRNIRNIKVGGEFRKLSDLTATVNDAGKKVKGYNTVGDILRESAKEIMEGFDVQKFIESLGTGHLRRSMASFMDNATFQNHIRAIEQGVLIPSNIVNPKKVQDYFKSIDKTEVGEALTKYFNEFSGQRNRGFTMSRTKLIDYLTKDAGLSKQDAARAIEDLVTSIGSENYQKFIAKARKVMGEYSAHPRSGPKGGYGQSALKTPTDFEAEALKALSGDEVRQIASKYGVSQRVRSKAEAVRELSRRDFNPANLSDRDVRNVVNRMHNENLIDLQELANQVIQGQQRRPPLQDLIDDIANIAGIQPPQGASAAAATANITNLDPQTYRRIFEQLTAGGVPENMMNVLKEKEAIRFVNRGVSNAPRDLSVEELRPFLSGLDVQTPVREQLEILNEIADPFVSLLESGHIAGRRVPMLEIVERATAIGKRHGMISDTFKPGMTATPLPNIPELGDLAGKHVNEFLAKEIYRSMRYPEQRNSVLNFINDMRGTIAAGYIASPKSIMVNVPGGIFSASYYIPPDVYVSEMISTWQDLARASRMDTPRLADIDELQHFFNIDASFMSELRRLSSRFDDKALDIAGLTKGNFKQKMQSFMDMYQHFLTKPGGMPIGLGAFGFTETVMRVSAYRASKRLGYSMTEAAEVARRATFDYGELPELINIFKRIGVVTLPGFTFFNTQRLVEMALNRPGTLGAWDRFGDAVWNVTAGSQDEKLQTYMSMEDWVRDDNGIPIRYRDDGRGNRVASVIPMNQIIPTRGFLGLGNPIIQDAGAGGLLTPIFDFMAAFVTGSGQAPISGRYGSRVFTPDANSAQQFAQALGFIYNSYAPAMARNILRFDPIGGSNPIGFDGVGEMSIQGIQDFTRLANRLFDASIDVPFEMAERYSHRELATRRVDRDFLDNVITSGLRSVRTVTSQGELPGAINILRQRQRDLNEEIAAIRRRAERAIYSASEARRPEVQQRYARQLQEAQARWLERNKDLLDFVRNQRG